MDYAAYLKPVQDMLADPAQKLWFDKLRKRAQAGLDILAKASPEEKERIRRLFDSRVRTEEIKAWYGEPEGDSLFQGTSVTSLTIPHVLQEPLNVTSIEHLEDLLASAYIARHDALAPTVREAIMENVDHWLDQGLFYGVVVCSKIIAQAFGLSLRAEDAIFDVDGHRVDPHEITHYPTEVREKYFERCRERVECFQGLDMERRDFESSLALADISKPKVAKYRDKVILAPVLCNDLCSVLSQRVTGLIREKTGGRVNPKGLTVVVYDTDTPYTYHEIMGFGEAGQTPVLPGLVVLGSSGTIDAFRWLYTYRVSLLAQKVQKGSLYSQVHRRFMPFVFFGVLVWRDAEILLDMDNLHRLRYRGNIFPGLEYAYMVPGLGKQAPHAGFDLDAFMKKHDI